jgi:hypothetical protein
MSLPYSPITVEMYEVLTLEGRMRLLDYVTRDLAQYSDSLEYQLELDNLQDELKPEVNKLLKNL